MIVKRFPEDFIVEEVPFLKPKKSGRYTYFLLEKKSMNTEDAINIISAITRIPKKFFSYSGTKDKNALTSQYVSVKGDIKDISGENFSVRVIGRGDFPIYLGQHKKNKFRIIVRDCYTMPDIRVKFFTNYFDEQRFSTKNVDIGIALLKKEFKIAAELIDYKESRYHLSLHPQDYIGAIRKVPFRLLKMYVHAVQSWLWNEAATLYIKTLGVKSLSLKYSKGEFLFPLEKIRNINIPLISFDAGFERKKSIKGVYEKVMNNAMLKREDFVLRSLPSITPVGGERKLIAYITKLKIERQGEKEFVVSFELEKGSYATMALKRLFIFPI